MAVGAFFDGRLQIESVARRPSLSSQFLGRVNQFGHWQVFDCHHDFFLAPNFVHPSLPHRVTSVSSMDAACGGSRTPSPFFTKASSTAKNDSMAAEDMAIIGTQIEESLAQTSEEFEIAFA